MGRQIHVDPPAKRTPAPESLADVKWLTVTQTVAKMRTYSPAKIRQLAHAGQLETLQTSRKAKMWISERSVEAFLARGHRQMSVAS